MVGIGRAYSVPFQNIAVSAQQDLFYVKPAADKVCVIEAVYLSNVGGSADAGDAQEELYRVEMWRLASTVSVGSGGAAVTPVPLAVNDTAAGFTARANDTTVATSNGSTVVMHSDGMNVRVPYVWLPPPEHRHIAANAQAWVCRLVSTPADAVTMNGTAIVRELP